jgi:hypothetical protein
MRAPIDGCEKNAETIISTSAIEPCSTPSSRTSRLAQPDGRAQEKVSRKHSAATASDGLA